MGFSPSLTLIVNDECFYVMLRLQKVSRKNDPRCAAKSIMCVVHQWEHRMVPYDFDPIKK